jgi:predicted RNase H-like nuclease (RuvC/YqgF family)
LKQFGKSIRPHPQSICNSVKDQLAACIEQSKKDKMYVKESENANKSVLLLGKQLRTENQKLREDVRRLEEDRKYLSTVNYKLADTIEELKREITVVKLKTKSKSKTKLNRKSNISRSRTYYV